MNAPVGDPKTWPVPDSSTRGSFITPNTVSLVPIDTAIRPSRTKPVPIRLQGLSPDQTITLAAGYPYRDCQYRDKVPTHVHGTASDGSFTSRSVVVARTADVHHWLEARSIRFM